MPASQEVELQSENDSVVTLSLHYAHAVLDRKWTVLTPTYMNQVPWPGGGACVHDEAGLDEALQGVQHVVRDSTGA